MNYALTFVPRVSLPLKKWEFSTNRGGLYLDFFTRVCFRQRPTSRNLLRLLRKCRMSSNLKPSEGSPLLLTDSTPTLIEIPQPPRRLILGNLPELRRKPTPSESIADVVNEYGGICRLATPLGQLVLVGEPKLVEELCDEERFDKVLGPGLLAVRERIGDGLFTAWTHEKNWGLAHRILMPTFSHASMRAYVPDMVEMAHQLMETLERQSRAGHAVDVPAEMTKLTLDTIALCGFSYRFNSFSQKEQHPFVEAMITVLTEQQNSVARPAALSKLMIGARRRVDAASKTMNDIVSEIVSSRRQSGPLPDREDLLEHMLHGVDKQTGEVLSDENIRAQCLTFLVAGHETTSGLLSFATYYLMKNPGLAAKVQAEVDRVLGSDLSVAPSYEKIHALTYVQQVLEETLRLWPTAPAFSRGPKSEHGEVLGGKYFIPHGTGCMVALLALHRDKTVWGEDADLFDPNRFSAEARQTRTASAYFPFGTGARACIGRQFAMQEAKLVLGMLLQRFDLVDSENYQLRVKQSLTLKPEGYLMQLRPRQLRATSNGASTQTAPAADAVSAGRVGARLGLALRILYGSNLGTCEALANQLAAQGDNLGFDVKVQPLDEAVDRFGDEPLVIVCSSYNGAPPDNAAAFCAWLESRPDLGGVNYALFGCGNREWANTYQKVPRQLEAALEGCGARALLPLAEGDASGDLDGAFRSWLSSLWQALAQRYRVELGTAGPTQPQLSVEILEDLHPNPFAEVYEAAPMVVVESRELQTVELSGRSTRHVELALPEGASYRPGDHLGVIPQNSRTLVTRVAAAFGLTPEVRLRLHQRQPGASPLPTEQIVSVASLLSHYVELQEVATRHQLALMASYAESELEKQSLEHLSRDEAEYAAQVKAVRKSIVDLLEEYPSVRLPFAHYLELVSALKPRYYSISSSPVHSGRLLSVTVGVIDAQARHGRGRYRGTCSTYLGEIPRGQTVYAFLQSAQGKFGLPALPETPLIMVGAGTGVAPYRGFLQERASAKRAGHAVASSLLFFGCRHPEHDFIYRGEFEGWQSEGLVELVTAFSRECQSKVYVQDRLRERGADIWRALEQGGHLYVCGDASGMAAGVRQSLLEVVREHGAMSAERASEFLEQLAAENRYHLDVWAS